MLGLIKAPSCANENRGRESYMTSLSMRNFTGMESNRQHGAQESFIHSQQREAVIFSQQWAAAASFIASRR